MAAYLGSAFTGRRFHVAVNTLMMVLLVGIAVLLVVIIGYFIMLDIRARNRETLLRRVREATGYAVAGGQHSPAAQMAMPGQEELFSRRGMAVLAEAFDHMDAAAQLVLKNQLVEMGYHQFVLDNLSTDNEDYIIELLRMAGDMGMTGLEDKISSLLYTHRNNIDLQYQAFYTLSQLGSMEQITAVCMDEKYANTLSFRSLQEVLMAFSGNREELYHRLLAASDPYVVRICIKRIGAEGFIQLAPAVVPMLASGEMNVLIDAIRTLGMLLYRPATGQIAALLSHPRWEVRSVAATALGRLDAEAYGEMLITALCDSEWQVRYSAGAVLAALPDSVALRHKVVARGDKFALEMLDYMLQQGEIWRQAQ